MLFLWWWAIPQTTDSLQYATPPGQVSLRETLEHLLASVPEVARASEQGDDDHAVPKGFRFGADGWFKLTCPTLR